VVCGLTSVVQAIVQASSSLGVNTSIIVLRKLVISLARLGPRRSIKPAKYDEMMKEQDRAANLLDRSKGSCQTMINKLEDDVGGN
jgi:hypothetical protein